MMRPNLHLISERRRHRHGAGHDTITVRRPSGPARGRRVEAPSRAAPPAAPQDSATPVRDEAAQRVREAGGPVDQGSYSCCCGFVFEAPVSTTVACPHCGDSQAW